MKKKRVCRCADKTAPWDETLINLQAELHEEDLQDFQSSLLMKLSSIFTTLFKNTNNLTVVVCPQSTTLEFLM